MKLEASYFATLETKVKVIPHLLVEVVKESHIKSGCSVSTRRKHDTSLSQTERGQMFQCWSTSSHENQNSSIQYNRCQDLSNKDHPMQNSIIQAYVELKYTDTVFKKLTENL